MDTADIPNKAPTPWIPETNLQRCAVLGKSVEELGELITILGRIQIQGIDGVDPKTGKPNRIALEEEVGDVLARCQGLIKKFDLRGLIISSRSELKFHFLEKWLALLADDHDGWYPVDEVSMPREVFEGDMSLSAWLQPLEAIEDISEGIFAHKIEWNAPPHAAAHLELGDVKHWRLYIEDRATLGENGRCDYRITHWRYTNNPPTSTPTLGTS